MGKLSILLACEFYAPSVGGVQEVMRQIAERLVDRGHSVTVATTWLQERTTEQINGVDIAQFSIAGNAVAGLSGEVERYRQFLVDARFDLVMVKAAQQWTFDAMIAVLDRLRMKSVFIPCGFSKLFEPEYEDYYRDMPRALRKFDRLVFYATHYRDIDFARQHGIDSFCVLPNGADEREFSVPRDPAFRRRHSIPEEAFLLITVGNVNVQKGHHELLESLPWITRARPVFLLMIGARPSATSKGLALARQVRAAIGARGPAGLIDLMRRLLSRAREAASRPVEQSAPRASLDTLLARANKPGKAPRAALMALPRAEVLQAYLNADLFVFASNVEYSPLVLFEAAAAGLPFLSVPVGNAAEIAEWTGCGIICPAPQDARGYTRASAETLGASISQLVEDPARLQALGAVGRQRFLESYTWEAITRRYEALFLELCRAPAESGEPTQIRTSL